MLQRRLIKVIPPTYPRLIFITEHYAPSTGATAQLISDLVTSIHERFQNITIITSTPSDLLPTESNIIRLKVGTNLYLFNNSKTLRGLVFLLKATHYLLSSPCNPQLLIIVSNPPFIGLLGLVVKFVRGTKYLYLLQDIFPRSAELAGILPRNGAIISIWRYLIGETLRQSQRVVVLSQSMMARATKDFYLSKSPTVIPNWSVSENPVPTNRATNKYALKWGISDELVCLYSGNLGELHDIITILEAARLTVDTNIRFVFVGSGAKSEYVTQYITAFDLDNITINDYVPLDDLHLTLSLADLCFVSMSEGADDTVAPSKLYGILSNKKPVLLIASSSSEQVSELNSFNYGAHVEPGDPVSLARLLKHLVLNRHLLTEFGLNSFETYKRLYTRKQATERWANLITTLISS